MASLFVLACLAGSALPAYAVSPDRPAGRTAPDTADASRQPDHRRATTKGVIVWTQHLNPDGIDHLFIARADGSQQRVLTPEIADSGDIDAQVSPDGRWVAYQHNTPTADTAHLIRPDGTSDHRLDVGCVDPCIGIDAPTWLSGNRIAFTRLVGPLNDNDEPASAVLYTVRPDGSHLRRLSAAGIDGNYEDRYARLSADRRYLTFQRLRLADSRTALFRMASDSSHARQITPWGINAGVYDLSTAWSGPTKDLIVFQSQGRGDPDDTFIDMGFVPATCMSVTECTSKIVWMTDNGATGRRTSNPQWSPDGHSLVFVDRPNVADGNAEIWTMRYGGTGSDRRKISTSDEFDYRPAWGTTARRR